MLGVHVLLVCMCQEAAGYCSWSGTAPHLHHTQLVDVLQLSDGAHLVPALHTSAAGSQHLGGAMLLPWACMRYGAQ
jgi:hypothetical protein